MIRTVKYCALAFASLLGCAAHAATPVRSCESLAAVSLQNVTITVAKTVAAGSFTAPNGQTFANMPSFCQVHGVAAPTSVSVINFEVWIPIANWNGRFNGVGNGGLAGTISYSAMAPVVQQGFAAASTDTGHVSAEPQTWLLSQDRVIDYSYRGFHLTTQYAKSLIAALYGSGPAYSYYTGCSTGGKQGLMEAQRFPEDYDGLVAGDPANYWTMQMASEVWDGQATFGAANLPTAKLPIVNSAVLAACGNNDGGLPNDAFLTNPDSCNFDPGVLQCPGADAPTCLTAPQVAAVRKIYQGPTNPTTGANEYPGLPRGSEVGWGPAGGQFVINRTVAQGSGVSSFDWFRFAVFNNPSWDYTTLNFDTDIANNNAIFGPITNATDANIFPLRARGGKLILYHGYADPLIPPENTINYYNNVVNLELQQVPVVSDPAFRQRMALGKTQVFARLFLVPGMYHCAGGPGPTTFDFLTPLTQWVEAGVAPERVVASHVESGTTTYTRPLCSWPASAFYSSGPTTDASSFVCR
jgi:tannase/feruloyl esterase